MKIVAYPLYEGAATLRPAPRERDWLFERFSDCCHV